MSKEKTEKKSSEESVPTQNTQTAVMERDRMVHDIDPQSHIVESNDFDPEFLTREEIAEKAGGWALYMCNYGEQRIQLGKREIVSVGGVAKEIRPRVLRFKRCFYKTPLSDKNAVKILDIYAKTGRCGVRRIMPGAQEYKAGLETAL